METPSVRHVMYARRSSDRDDQQILSLEQQLTVLREVAFTKSLEVVDAVTESASAKEPSRPGFLDLVRRIEKGQADAVLVWKLDRLARNAVDAGLLIHLLSTGRLKAIVTPDATYTGSGDMKFMLSMLFGAAAKYSDDLGAAVRRGEEDVLRRGGSPGPVPLGRVAIEIVVREHVPTITFRAPFVLGRADRREVEAVTPRRWHAARDLEARA